MLDTIINNGFLLLLFVSWVVIVASPSYRFRWLVFLTVGLFLLLYFWIYLPIEDEAHRVGH